VLNDIIEFIFFINEFIFFIDEFIFFTNELFPQTGELHFFSIQGGDSYWDGLL